MPYDNAARGRTWVGANNRPLKNHSATFIEGKQGRFRQNPGSANGLITPAAR